MNAAQAKAKRDAKRPAKHRLPDIETKPARPSAIRTPAEQDALERGEAAKVRTAEARARSAEAKAARDETPKAPEGGAAAPTPTLGKAADKVGGFVVRAPRRVLVTEFLAAGFLITVRHLADGETPGIEPYVGAFVVYLLLGFASELGGDQTAKVAAGLGGLVVLAIAVRTVGPLMTGAGVLASGGAPVVDIGPRHNPRRPPGTRLRGNNLNNPNGRTGR